MNKFFKIVSEIDHTDDWYYVEMYNEDDILIEQFRKLNGNLEKITFIETLKDEKVLWISIDLETYKRLTNQNKSKILEILKKTTLASPEQNELWLLIDKIEKESYTTGHNDGYDLGYDTIKALDGGCGGSCKCK